MNRKIDLIYIDSGGGHKAAATALSEVIGQQRRPWDLRLRSIQKMLDSIDFVRRWTGIPFDEIYNIMLRHGWTLGTSVLIPFIHWLIRKYHREQVRVLEAQWKADRPDLVVSLIPHYNRALKESLERAWPGTPFITILTDIADYPPHFWMENQEQYVVCGSERAVIQARMIGLQERQILPVSGMILHPRFYAPVIVDREAERERLGLRADLPTGLVMFGGEGSMDLVKVARALNRDAAEVQLILICGRHQKAARALRDMPQHIPMFVEGFTKDIPHYMALSDFFIGKPGPGSISEALAMQLPVIVERNVWTLAQERYNAEWVRSRHLGIVVRNFRNVAGAVKELLQPDNYRQYRARAAAVRNHAVYEIPELFDEILTRHAGAVGLDSVAQSR